MKLICLLLIIGMSLAVDENTMMAAIEAESDGCGICTIHLVLADFINDLKIEKDDWVGVYCDQLPIEGDDVEDTSDVELDDGALGLMAFGQVKADNQIGISFIGIYENELVD
jgi:hypothetical protein